MVKLETIMPIVNIVVSAVAGLLYAFKADVGRSMYWISAAVLNFSITFLVK